MSDKQSTYVQSCLERFRAGDVAARNELLQCACDRLGQLTHRMLKGYPRLKRWEESDDVLQSAVVRLCQALQEVTPQSVRHFYRLAALQIRRELIDLARRYYGPQGPGAKHASNAAQGNSDSMPPLYEQADNSHESSRLAQWTEFHREVDALPDEEKEVFDLLWYQELPQAEAAALLQVDVRTVKRRWQAARLKLHQALHGELPA